jgi:hypothetical protein
MEVSRVCFPDTNPCWTGYVSHLADCREAFDRDHPP